MNLEFRIMRIKLVCLLLMGITIQLFLSCDGGLDDSSAPISPGNDEIKMDITILTDDDFNESADGVLRDITVLAFVEKDPISHPGEYYFAYQAVNIILTPIPVAKETGKWKVSAIIKKMDGKKQKFAFLGNLRAHTVTPTPIFTETEITGLSVEMQEALNRYVYKTQKGWGISAGGNTIDADGNSELFPMYGITQGEYELSPTDDLLTILTESVYLFRMVAKLEFFLHEDLTSKIDLQDEVVLKNAKKEGYVCYNPSSNYMNYINYQTYYNSSKETLHGLWAWIPNLPVATTKLYNQTYNLADFTPNAADYEAGSEILDCRKRISGSVYLNESGGYANKADTGPICFEFTEKLTDKTYILHLKADVLRNCHYRIVVHPSADTDFDFTAEISSWNDTYKIKEEL